MSKFSHRLCDSFIMVRVNFIPEKQGNFTTTICAKDSIKVGNQFFSATRPNGTVVIDRPSSLGCDSVVTVSINIAPAIVANFITEDLKCNVANTGVLRISTIGTGIGPYMVSVDNKPPVNFTPDLEVKNLALGAHTLRVIDPFGCDVINNFTINPSAVLALNLPADTTIFRGNQVNIVANASFVPAKITWDPVDFLSCTNCLNPVSAPDNTISYMLTLEDANGCVIKDNMTITVKVEESDVYIPNVFSPNGDGLNDFFEVVFRFPDRSKINILRIYDRWGALLFERTGANIGEPVRWDGRFQGRDLNPGVYVYALQYEAQDEEPKWRKGDINIVR